VFQIHPLQDLIQVDTMFDGSFIFTIGFVSFLLASICVGLASIFTRLNGKAGSMDIPSVLWTIGFVLLHGDIVLPLLFSLLWRVWPADMYMIRQFYLAWIPAAVAGPALWWLLLRLLDRERTVAGQFDVIDDELASGSKQV
jgi:hypothetical protein